MTAVHIVVDAEATPLGMGPHVRPGDITHIAALPRGMESGRASAAIVGKLKNGTVVLLQVSLRLLLDAATAFRARYGVEADGKSPAEHNEAMRDRINAALMLSLIGKREGSEVTIDIGELNALMQDTALAPEIAYSADGRSLTIRTVRSE